MMREHYRLRKGNSFKAHVVVIVIFLPAVISLLAIFNKTFSNYVYLSVTFMLA